MVHKHRVAPTFTLPALADFLPCPNSNNLSLQRMGQRTSNWPLLNQLSSLVLFTEKEVGTLRSEDTGILFISYWKVTLIFSSVLDPHRHPQPCRAPAAATHQGRHQGRAGDTRHLVHDSLFHVALNSLQHGALGGQGMGQEGTQSILSNL